jgi:putative addiction module component (TIGR02574 family)
MPPNLNDVCHQALQLPASDKEWLIEQLLATLAPDEPEIVKAWDAEIRARIEHHRLHGFETMTHDELMAKYRRA